VLATRAQATTTRLTFVSMLVDVFILQLFWRSR
jgi:hypothetical protein